MEETEIWVLTTLPLYDYLLCDFVDFQLKHKSKNNVYTFFFAAKLLKLLYWIFGF